MVTCVPLIGNAVPYNQAALLAHDIAHEADLTFYDGTLQYKQKTTPLDKVSAQEQLARLEGAISFDERLDDIIKQRRVLMVDDILTMGSALSSATEALINAGCKSVDVTVLGHSIKKL